MEIEDRLTIGLGVATLAGLVAMLYGVLVQLLPPASEQQYWIEFRQPVHGLERNAAVTMRGVKIGRVSAIARSSDPLFGHVTRIQVDINAADVPITGDGAPVIREVLDPDLAVRAGAVGGDTLVACHAFDALGALVATHRVSPTSDARRALDGARRDGKDGGYALELERFGARRLLAFSPADGDLGLTFADGASTLTAAAPASPATRDQGLAPRDLVRAMRGTRVGTVAEAEQALLALGRIFDGRSVCAIVYVRPGDDTPRLIALSGRDGAPVLSFWNRGTRATLESNLVTGIKKVELTGDLPLDDSGRTISTPIPRGGSIPADEGDLFAEVSALVRRRLPVMLRRVDALLVEAGRVGEQAALGLEEARGIVAKLDRSLAPEGDLGHMFASLRTVADDVRRWTAPDGRIEILLKNVETLSAPDGNVATLVAESRDAIAKITSEVESALAATRRTLEEGDLKRILANVERMTGDGPDSTRKRLDDLLATLDKAVTTLDRQLVANGKLEGLVDQLGYAVRRDLRAALAQVGDGMNVLKQTLIQMQSNPDSLLLGKRK